MPRIHECLELPNSEEHQRLLRDKLADYQEMFDKRLKTISVRKKENEGIDFMPVFRDGEAFYLLVNILILNFFFRTPHKYEDKSLRPRPFLHISEIDAFSPVERGRILSKRKYGDNFAIDVDKIKNLAILNIQTYFTNQRTLVRSMRKIA